jgi:DNA-binding MltR family transcriptional regulator
MEQWQPLNMEIRSWAISHVLRLEQTSSSLMRAILRMFKEDSKTLGHQSSALSFKAKMDLLYDLEELEKEDYNHLLKLMEIRNQFAHNHNAVSFESFDDINPDINKYLEKNIPEEIAKEADRETKLKAAFSAMFTKVAGRLLVLEIEYTKGISKEVQKYVNHKVVENIDSIWQNALERTKADKVFSPIQYMMTGSPKELDILYSSLKLSMSEFTLKEMDGLKGEEFKKVFKQKETTEEMLARMENEEGDKKG